MNLPLFHIDFSTLDTFHVFVWIPYEKSVSRADIAHMGPKGCPQTKAGSGLVYLGVWCVM